MKKLLLAVLFIPTFVFAQSRQMVPLDLQNDLKTITPDQRINLYLRGDLSQLTTFVRTQNGTIKGTLYNILSCAIPASSIPALNTLQGLDYVEYSGGTPQVLDDVMRINNNVLPVHLGASALPQPYLGEDVIMGFIDTGVELAHPDFHHLDGTTRVIALWDQTQDEAIPQRVPQPYGYGQEWNAEDIDAGITNHDDPANQYGHGSTVVGVGAGNGNSTNDFVGVAPKADIIMVASDLSSPNWTSTVADAVDFIFAKAEALGKPAVVNLSLGDYYGSHDGLDAPSLFVDSLLSAAPGRAMVAAAGNSGNIGNYHLAYEIPEADTAFTWFKYNNTAQAVFFELWTDTADFLNTSFSIGADLTVPSYSFRGYASWRMAQQNLDSIITDTIFYNSAMLGIVDTWCGQRGGQYQIQVQVRQAFSNQYLWRFSTTGGGTFDCWSYAPFGTSAIVNTSLPDAGTFPDMVHYQLPDHAKTLVDSWACSEKVITVGNYINRNEFTNYLHEQTIFQDTPGEISINSSRGPTRDNRQKPDVTATGDHTLTAGRLATLTSFINTSPEKVAEDGMHYINGGTSIASPVVAGVVALYFERDSEATYLSVKNAVIDNALADQFTGILPGDQWGYGKIDAFAVLTIPFVISYSASIRDLGNLNIYPNPTNGQLTIESGGAAIESVAIFDIAGRLIGKKGVNTNGASVVLDCSDLPNGIYFIHSQLANGQNAISKLSVEK